jgi:hypothetical protein
MINQSNKEVKEQFPALFHLHLHRAAALECLPASDDECEIVRPQT